MSVDPYDPYSYSYNMNHQYRGLAIIFNHVFFDDPNNSPRHSSNADVTALTETLLKLHFHHVMIRNDYTFNQIKTLLEQISKYDHSNHDCIVIAILSHGGQGYIQAKDMPYRLDALTTYFKPENCPSLAGKPKICIIQACQGDQIDRGFQMVRLPKENNPDSIMEGHNCTQTDGNSFTPPSYKIPNNADFLIVYSTMPGYVSYREKEGSWFIQTFCKELNENGKRYEITELLRIVNLKVAVDFKSYPDENKQIPCIMSMLTARLTFN